MWLVLDCSLSQVEGLSKSKMAYFVMIANLCLFLHLIVAFHEFDVLTKSNGMVVNNVVIVGDSTENLYVNLMIEWSQELELPMTLMTLNQMGQIQNQHESLIVIFEEEIGNWSSSMMAENQFLILSDLPTKARYSTMKKTVIEKVANLGMNSKLRFDSQVYFGFTDYTTTIQLYEVRFVVH